MCYLVCSIISAHGDEEGSFSLNTIWYSISMNCCSMPWKHFWSRSTLPSISPKVTDFCVWGTVRLSWPPCGHLLQFSCQPLKVEFYRNFILCEMDFGWHRKTMSICQSLLSKWDTSWPRVDAHSELCYPFSKGGNPTFIATMVSGHSPRNE